MGAGAVAATLRVVAAGGRNVSKLYWPEGQEWVGLLSFPDVGLGRGLPSETNSYENNNIHFVS